MWISICPVTSLIKPLKVAILDRQTRLQSRNCAEWLEISLTPVTATHLHNQLCKLQIKEIMLNANLMQQCSFIDIFLAQHVSSTYAHHQEHGTIRTIRTTHAAALKTTTHPKTRCRKPYVATQHLMFLMMGVCTQNMSS